VELLVEASFKVVSLPFLGSTHVFGVQMVTVDSTGARLYGGAFSDALGDGSFRLGSERGE